jgi:hypothetical protein
MPKMNPPKLIGPFHVIPPLSRLDLKTIILEKDSPQIQGDSEKVMKHFY